MRTNHTATRKSSDQVAMRPIVDRQMSVKTLPSLAVGNKLICFVFLGLQKTDVELVERVTALGENNENGKATITHVHMFNFKLR